MSQNTTPISTNELTARLQKAENIKARDGVVWKDKFDRTHTIESARELPDDTPVRLAGRVTALRWLGKLMFGRIYDIDGEIQFSMSREELGEENYKFITREDVKVSEIDDHEIHIAEHTSFMLSGEFANLCGANPELEETVLAHIRAHKKLN